MKEMLQIHSSKLYNIPKIGINYLTETGDEFIGSKHVYIS